MDCAFRNPFNSIMAILKEVDGMNFIIKKRADLTSTQLVLIILAVMAFAIILILIFKFNLWPIADKETCHQSVIYRATLPKLVQDYIPLKCKTQRYCITSGLFGDNCKELGKEYSKVRVSDVEQIEQFIAQETIDCWSMMGEGKVSLFSQYIAETYGFGSVAPSCVICSRIAFDEEKLTSKGINLDEINVEDYMRTHAPSGKSISYLGYVAGEGGKISLSDIKPVAVTQAASTGPITKKEENGQVTIVKNDKPTLDEAVGSVALAVDKPDGTTVKQQNDAALQKIIDDNKGKKPDLAIMFMQISSPEYSQVIKKDLNTFFGVTLTVSGILGSPKAIYSTVKSLAKGGWYTVAIAAIVGGIQMGNVAYNRVLTAGYCGDISTGTEARTGCSVVRAVDYDLPSISQYCVNIESIP
jgi:hypothetical protein